MSILRTLLILMGLGLCTAVAQERMIGESQQPTPPSGSTTTFNYWKSGPTSDYYVVQSSANTGFSFMVSDNFLGLVLRSAPVDDKTRLSMLAQYPFFMNALYEGRMATNYPDATKDYDQPFASLEAEGLSITQDDLASPYVRVRVTNPDGTVEEFSVNRDLVDRILSEQDWETTNLVAALQSYPYRLPDNARVAFRNLTQQQIFDLAEATPGVARQEFVKTRRLYMQPQHVQAMSNAAVVAAETEPSEPGGMMESVDEPVRERPAVAAKPPKPAGLAQAPSQPGAGSPQKRAQRAIYLSLFIAAMAAAFVIGRQSRRR